MQMVVDKIWPKYGRIEASQNGKVWKNERILTFLTLFFSISKKIKIIILIR